MEYNLNFVDRLGRPAQGVGFFGIFIEKIQL